MLLKELKLQYNFVYKRTPGFKFQVSSFKFQVSRRRFEDGHFVHFLTINEFVQLHVHRSELMSRLSKSIASWKDGCFVGREVHNYLKIQTDKAFDLTLNQHYAKQLLKCAEFGITRSAKYGRLYQTSLCTHTQWFHNNYRLIEALKRILSLVVFTTSFFLFCNHVP